MVNLEANYAGLKLRSPFVVSSCGLTENLERVRKCEEFGAGAVIVKSIFEEEVSRVSPTPRFWVSRFQSEQERAFTFMSYEQGAVTDLDGFCRELERMRKGVSIPVIPSINCITDEGWARYAKAMENAGVPAIEINVSCPHGSIAFRGGEVERLTLEAVKIVRQATKLPVQPKITPQLTNPVAFVADVAKLGVDGVTLFNRHTALEIDPETGKPVMHEAYMGHGGPWTINLRLRWLTAIYPHLQIPISGSGGVITALDAAKYILSGASTVQVASVVYLQGYQVLRQLNADLARYMQQHGYKSLDDFRGAVIPRIKGTHDVVREHVYVSQIRADRPLSPCVAACPIEQGGQGYVRLLAQGKVDEALEAVKLRNPFPAICGRVCHHPCEEECTRAVADEPVAICGIKRFLADFELAKKGTGFGKFKVTRKEKVAIIGSGPAGLSAAVELARRGYPVTVFEKEARAGGMLEWGLPGYRLPREVIRREIADIAAAGVKLRTKSPLGKKRTLAALKREGFKAIFLAVGATLSKALPLPGSDLAGVRLGLDFLREVNEKGKRAKTGKKVIVIGGGNVAIDAARSARRLGAKVDLVCLEPRDHMPAHEWEIAAAEEEGVRLRNSLVPQEILGKNGKNGRVSGLRLAPVESLKLTADDRLVSFKAYGGAGVVLSGDAVIVAVGTGLDRDFLAGAGGLKLEPHGTIRADAVTLATNLPGVFAGGDATLGPASVTEAIACGMRAAESVDRYLSKRDLAAGREPQTRVAEKLAALLRARPEKAARQKMPAASARKRLASFLEVEQGFTREQAIKEAQRCLACGCGLGCGLCERVCIYFAVNREGDRFVIDPAKCDGCGLCVRLCPNQTIELVREETLLSPAERRTKMAEHTPALLEEAARAAAAAP